MPLVFVCNVITSVFMVSALIFGDSNAEALGEVSPWVRRLLWEGEQGLGFHGALRWPHIDLAPTCLASLAEGLEQYTLSCPTSQWQQLLKVEEGRWHRGERAGGNRVESGPLWSWLPH